MPRIIGSLPFDRWENEVLKLLKNQLPEDWVVITSVMWSLMKHGYVREGEADFVILVPNSGLVVLEVKGSKEFKVGDNGVWARKQDEGFWVELRESPPEQATRNMHDLTTFLNERNQWINFPGRFSYLVIYPQGEAQSLPPMFDESTIATRRHVYQLATRVRNSLDKRGGEGRAEKFTSSVMESIIDDLKNRKFHIQKADTGEEVSDDTSMIEKLTRQQFASLRGLFQMPSVAVIGPAGSGKTVLAIWRLKALVEQGFRVVYLCYNRALAKSLRLRNPEHEEYIWNIDRFFLELCPDSRSYKSESNFYREILPFRVINNSSEIEKFDAIIVDEGQDFSEEQVIALLDILSEDGEWTFFADWKQDLYNAGKGTPIGAEVIFHLHHNCRNTQKINDASNHFLNLKIESMPGMPLGVLPRIEYSKNQVLRAWEIAKEWVAAGPVVILSPYKFENSCMNGQDIGYGLRLTREIKEFGMKNTVYFSTIKSFKGIEAVSVIVVDVGIPNEYPAFNDEDLYVACTRATARLAILVNKESAVKHYKLLS